jgi:predicted glutamine amidotransferase
MNRLVDIARGLAAAAPDAGTWGAAYCYGNRLETVRSVHPCGQDPEFANLGVLRTDMVFLQLEPGVTHASMREVQPFTRRESGKDWAFCHWLPMENPRALDPGGRIVDSSSPSERYFLHLLARLDAEAPQDSLTKALGEVAGEKTLSCCLMSCDALTVACWHDEDPEAAGGLWLGRGELARFVASQPLHSIPETSWEPMANQTVLSITRFRHELP